MVQVEEEEEVEEDPTITSLRMQGLRSRLWRTCPCISSRCLIPRRYWSIGSQLWSQLWSLIQVSSSCYAKLCYSIYDDDCRVDASISWWLLSGLPVSSYHRIKSHRIISSYYIIISHHMISQAYQYTPINSRRRNLRPLPPSNHPWSVSVAIRRWWLSYIKREMSC